MTVQVNYAFAMEIRGLGFVQFSYAKDMCALSKILVPLIVELFENILVWFVSCKPINDYKSMKFLWFVSTKTKSNLIEEP